MNMIGQYVIYETDVRLHIGVAEKPFGGRGLVVNFTHSKRKDELLPWQRNPTVFRLDFPTHRLRLATQDEIEELIAT